MRKHHVIRVPSRMTFIKNAIFYDTETKQIPIEEKTIEQQFWFGYAQFCRYAKNQQLDDILFYDIDSFWDWVISKTQIKETVWLIAHNQDFDLRVTKGLSQLLQRGFFVHKAIFETGRFMVIFKDYKPSKDGEESNRPPQGCRTIQAHCTLNWFKASLKKLGEIVGVEKLQMPEYTDDQSEWEWYCKQDVETLKAIVESYQNCIRDNGLGTIAPTIAKQALNAFTFRFMQHPIEVHTDDRATKLERDSYRGGRTEAFFIGRKNSDIYYKVDINSMYPFVMRDCLYPIKFCGIRKMPNKRLLNRFKTTGLVIAKCDVSTKIPCVPLTIDERLCFPTF